MVLSETSVVLQLLAGFSQRPSRGQQNSQLKPVPMPQSQKKIYTFPPVGGCWMVLPAMETTIKLLTQKIYSTALSP